MNIVKYRTADFVPTAFATLVDRLFDNSLNRGVLETSFTPRTDVVEFEKEFEIQLAVPGMRKEDFKIDLQDNYLTVSGERKAEDQKKNGHFYTRETHFGSFNRSFYLPETVNAAGITASYHNGILEIRLPKDEKKVLKHSIDVK
jgi:HSP20 family protein